MTQEFYSWVNPKKSVNIYSKKTYTRMFTGTYKKKLATPMTGMKESWYERNHETARSNEKELLMHQQ